MATTLTFYGGVRLIGGTKVLVETDGARILLDVGEDIPDGTDLFRAPATIRPERALSDKIRVGAAPAIPGFWDAAALRADGPGASSLAALADADPRPRAATLSHAHIDHDGLMAHLDAAIPVYAHPDTVAMERRLADLGWTTGAALERLRALESGEEVVVGDVRVRQFRVDHDVRGASGTIVTTPDGVIAYTGDINLHRDGGVHSREFAAQAKGADVLIIETTMLSFDDVTGPARTEDEIADIVVNTLSERAGTLALLSCYERDIDRAVGLIAAAERAGRRIVWPGRFAALLAAWGVSGLTTWDTSRLQTPDHAAASEKAQGLGVETVSLADVAANPGGFVVQTDARDVGSLLDLPITADSELRPGTPWIHSQGEPLGPFMDSWAVWMDWLGQLGVDVVPAGSTGHAMPDDLVELCQLVGAGRVVAVHGFHPERLQIPGAETILPELGEPITL